MKKTMNKKGFTLVELLAVIVILAVIVLVAMNAVIPQMEKSRKNAFMTEVETFAKAAETWYTEINVVENTSGDKCVPISDVVVSGKTIKGLIGEYVDKKSDVYKGNVCIVTSDVKDASGDYTKSKGTKIIITNGAYYFKGDSRDIKVENILDGNKDGGTEITNTSHANDTVKGFLTAQQIKENNK